MTNEQYFKRKDLSLYDFKNKEMSVTFLMKEMLVKLYSIFEYENLPENITKRNIETYLMRGHCEFIEEKDQLWPMMGGLCGVEKSPVYDFTQATIANPALNISKTYTDGVDCVIVRNDPLYMGVYEILRRYCSLMAEGNLSLYVYASFWSRLHAVISAQDETARKSAEDFIENIIRGEYSTIAEGKLLEGIKVSPLSGAGNGGILPLLEMLQYTQAELNKAFGLSSNNNRKREALSSDETSTDDAILLPFIDVMLEEREEGIDKVNKLFGTDIKVRKASSWEIVEEEMEAQVEALEAEADAADEADQDEEIEEKEEREEEKKDDEADA